MSDKMVSDLVKISFYYALNGHRMSKMKTGKGLNRMRFLFSL